MSSALNFSSVFSNFPTQHSALQRLRANNTRRLGFSLNSTG